MAIGAVYIWSYVYNIIRAYGSKSNRNNDMNDSTISIKSSEEISERLSDSFTETLLSKDCSTSEDNEAQIEQTRAVGSEDKVTTIKDINQRMKSFAEKINLKMLIAPSTIATIVGLLIGVVSPIRKIFIGDSAPLRVIDSSASMLGEASIPAMTLIVGANLLRGLKKSDLSIWVIIGVQVVRYIALPLSGIGVVKAAQHFGMVGSDSLYQFVLLLQYALPSAMAIGTITQLFGVGESECSVIMLWNYAIASVSLTLWSTYFMWMVS